MSTFQGMSSVPHLHTLLYQYFYVLPLALCASYIIYQRVFSPLAKVPGPFLPSISSWWLVYHTRTKQFHRTSIALHKAYGPIIRIAPNEVSIADPAAIRTIYGAGGGFRKSDWYSVWQGTRTFDLFAGRDEKVHGQHRKIVARAYTMETLKDLEPYVDDCLAVFMRKMDEEIATGDSIDMAKWVQLFAFDVVGEITWSKSMNFLNHGKDDGTFATILSTAYSASWLGQVPYVFHIHEFLKPIIGNWLGANARHGSLREFAVRETAKRKENPGGKRDIISRLFEQHEKMPDEFSYGDVVSMATSNVNAGSDTTAAVMRAMIYHLLRNPSAKASFLAEIDEARREGRLSNPVKYEEAMKLKYLQAVMNEGLRIHPAVGISLPRVVPPGGTHLAGHYIPAGNVVGVNAFVVHRDRNVFGEDADEFRPERWLENDTTEMVRCSLAFGGGSRACIGRNISWLEMSKIMPTLFLKYELELEDPSKEWEEEVILFVLQKGMNVVMKPRKDPLEQA